MLTLTQRRLSFYAVHRERPFYSDLVRYMSSGPVIVQMLEGEGAIAKNRDIMGATDPKKAAPGTIRADLAAEHRAECRARFGCCADRRARDRVLLQHHGAASAHLKANAKKSHGEAATRRIPTCWASPAPSSLRRSWRKLGSKPFRARQLMNWLYKRGASSLRGHEDLAKDFRALLAGRAEVRPPKIVASNVPPTARRKWLLRADAAQAFEMVFIPEADRGTLCISSQVGCALDCSFCATAQQGFNRNLSTAEIVGQVWLACRNSSASRQRRASARREPLPRLPPTRSAPGSVIVTNVVLMGMGEPLANFRNVVPALRILLDDFGFDLSRRRVTLSTSGLAPQIYKLAQEINVALAVSLHAPDDELRNELVPINRKHPIARTAGGVLALPG